MDRFNLDWIAPVIFILIYFVSRLFSRGKDEEGEQPDAPEVERRTRDLQEEIRRRIAERQQQHEAQRPVATQQPQSAPAQSQRGTYREPARTPPPPPIPQPALVETQARMAAQMEQLRESQMHIEQSRRERSSPTSARAKQTTYGARTRTGRSDLRSAIRRMGKDPQNTRLAFLYAEILGPPVGSRRRRFMQYFED